MTTDELSVLPRDIAYEPFVGPSRRSRLWRAVRLQPVGAFSLLIIIGLVLVAIFADYVAPFDPTNIDARALQSPNSTHWFGTDNFGRDVFSRVVFGSRISLQVGIIATSIGVTGGGLIGLVSAYFGGTVDILVQRLVDAMMAFPFLVIALIMIAVVGPSIRNVMIVVGIAIMPGVSRVIRGIVLSEKENLYILSARAVGASNARVMLRHILPNLVAPLVIIASSVLPGAVLVEAGLSFLGLGTPPPTASWGADLSGNARSFFEHAPWMAIFPGLALSTVVLAFNLFGDAIRDLVDPRLRNR
jgi:peptide/nickel transport system permease protein